MLGLFSRWELKAAASDSDEPAAFGQAADDWVVFRAVGVPVTLGQG